MNNKKLIVTAIIIWILLVLAYIFKPGIKENIWTQVENTHKNQQETIKDTAIAINHMKKKDLKLIGKLKKYEKYDTFTGFLADMQKELTWINLDLLKDDFVVCLTWDSGSGIIYIPIYQDEIKKWYYETWTVMYNYMSYIDEAISNKCIYGWYKSHAGSKVIFERDFRNELHTTLDDIFNRRANVYEVIKWIEKTKNKWKRYKELLAYLYDFVWDYKSWLDLKQEVEKKSATINMKWLILDENEKPIKWAKIYLLNENKYFDVSNENWEYSLNFKYYPFSHLRFKVTKKGYSDAYFTIPLDFSKKQDWEKRVTKNFHLVKSKNIDKRLWGVKKPDAVINWKKYYIFKTKQSTYYVPVDGLHYKNWKQFKKWKITVYLYEFNKWSKIDDLMNSDTFSPVYGYVGNLMKTFGMPYIQFFDDKGKELFVYKSNPMILINQIYHMKELYENYDKIYTAITDEDMQYLYQVSKKGGYPITYHWLIENNFLRWPTWWTLEREKWTWISLPHKVIDPKWLVQLEFWQIAK